MNKTGFLAALSLLVAVLISSQAEAFPRLVQQAKDNCVVGEQADGYLGFVPNKSVSTELRREVRQINQQRKGVYVNLARENGTTVEVTAALTAEKLIRRAGRGECVRGTDGRWAQK